MPPTLQADSGMFMFLIYFDKEVHVQTGNESISPINLSLRNHLTPTRRPCLSQFFGLRRFFFNLLGIVSGCLDVVDGDWMTVMFFHCSTRVRLDD